ncbi:MAG: hypothetical protein HY904_03395 [Deltaproteobacteria bacterium]|nr:hypothetical protein [Deltaproteobacteria bacterium]
MDKRAPSVFRPYLLVRLAVAVALVAWMVITLLAARLGVDGDVLLQALAFCTLFTVLAFHYWPMELRVDGTSLHYRGFLGELSVPLSAITDIEVTPIPGMTNYGVLAPQGSIVFTSFIAGHRQLLDLLVSRAHLSPHRA